jgi:ATP-dependent Zn protease
VLFGRVSTQIDNDKDSTNASDLATKMVTSFGFSETVGQVNFTQENMYSDATKRQIDIERQNIMNSAIAAAEEILIKNKEKLQEVVNLLIREEVLHASDLEKILGPKRTAEASVDEDV